MKALIVCKHTDYEKKLDLNSFFTNLEVEPFFVCKEHGEKSHVLNTTFAVSIGGDGTALSTAHLLIDEPLLAVNSSPETSVGALTTIKLPQLRRKLEEISKKSFKTENLDRIEVSINNKPIDFLALNDIFIGNENAYNISMYKLKFKSKEEAQRSSGVIFSTGTGSTAWFNSAGGTPFSPQSKFIKMIVREPYCNMKKCELMHQNLQINEGEEIEIIPEVKSILAIDSIREYKLSPKDIVKIKISSHPLKRIL